MRLLIKERYYSCGMSDITFNRSKTNLEFKYYKFDFEINDNSSPKLYSNLISSSSLVLMHLEILLSSFSLDLITFSKEFLLFTLAC